MSEERMTKAAAMPNRAKLTMVERVARALCAKRNAHLGSPDAETLVRGKPNWVFHVPDALTAIEAMRDPTPTMVQAMALTYDDEAIQAWHDAIDAALAEDPLPETKGIAAA